MSPRRWRAGCAAGLLWAGAALAQTPAPVPTPALESRPELQDALPQGKLIGKARLTVWGFDIYDARLWAAAGASTASVANAPLALELSYLRDFQAADIAERSLKEMRRSQPLSDAQASQWKADLLRVIPDVRKGDRLLGLHRPGQGARFWLNGQPTGEIQGAEFARLFFGIWLSPHTSEPRMRDALLAGAGK